MKQSVQGRMMQNTRAVRRAALFVGLHSWVGSSDEEGIQVLSACQRDRRQGRYIQRNLVVYLI